MQLADCLCLDLAHTLTGNAKVTANLFQRTGTAIVQTKAQADDLFLAVCGEAVVFPKKAPKHFFTMIKQQGALLAKGRLLGIQFDTLFTGNLYLEISKNAIETAAKLKAALKEKGYEFFINSPTNQIFVILENKKMEELGEKVKFSFWEKYDDSHTVVRFATSWATKMEDIDSLIETL